MPSSTSGHVLEPRLEVPQEQQLGAGTEYAGDQGSDQQAANRGKHTIVVGRRTNNHPGATVSRGPSLA
jgi:hypothetical protein